MQGQKNKLLLLFPLLLFILNLITKGLYLTGNEVGLDEPFSIYHAQFGLSDIIAQLKNYNNPPLYELLLHFWIKLFGISPLAVRALPCLFACLAPPALYFLGRKFFSTATGIFSSLILSFSSLLTFYSHDSRVYSLFALLSILSMHYYLKLLLEERSKWVTITFYFLFSSLLIYAHYFGFFVLLIQFIHLLLWNRSKLKTFLWLYLAVALLYLPHALPFLNRMGDSVAHGTWLNPPDGLESLYNMLWSFSNYPFITVVCITLLVAALIKLVWKKEWRTSQTQNKLVLIWFVLPFFGMFIVSFFVPMYISRYLIYVLPGYCLLLCLAAKSLIGHKTMRYSLLTLITLLFSFTNELKPDKKTMMLPAIKLIEKIKDQSTCVIVRPHDLNHSFSYHYNKDYFASVKDNKENHLLDSLLATDNVFMTWTRNDLPNGITKYKKLLYLYTGSNDEKDNAEMKKELGKSFTETAQVDLNYYYRLAAYKKK